MSDAVNDPFDDRSEAHAKQTEAERAAARIEASDPPLSEMLAQSMRRGDTVRFDGANGEQIHGEIITVGNDHVRLRGRTAAVDIDVHLVDYWIIHITPASAGGRQTVPTHDSWTSLVRSIARTGALMDCWLADGSRLTGEIVGVNTPHTHVVLSAAGHGTTWVPLSMFVAVTQPAFTPPLQ